MPDVVGRRRAVAVALIAAALLASIIPAVANSATTPPDLDRFLTALGKVESGGRYTAHNRSSGAYGKYQILPSSWAGWAAAYLGSSRASQTPSNQEVVARRKVSALYTWLDSWPSVAHWWLTGSGERNAARWSTFSRSYVDRVMTAMGSPGSVTSSPASVVAANASIKAGDGRVADNAAAVTYEGAWSTARYAAYSAGQVRYATRTGAAATLTFSGTGIAWIGPVGPTRGTARVYIDGAAVATVDLRQSTFAARKVVFARALTAGQHTIRIVVTSSGRPVAIDEFIVGS